VGKKDKESFVHLHCHSDMSQLDGCVKIEDYVAEAKKRGNPAVCVTDHGTMRGYLELHKYSEKYNIKPIYGVELYLTHDMHRKGLTQEEKSEITKGLKKSDHKKAISNYEDLNGIKDRWHLTCWALNNQGMQNLYKLSSLGYIQGFYYRPRIDLKTLCQYNEGLAVATGCVGGPAYQMYIDGKKRWAYDFVDKLSETFKDRFYIEIQPHSIDIQNKVNKIALKFKERTGAKLIACQDAHYLNQEDWKVHDVLLCIGTHSFLDDKNRFSFPSHEFYYKTKKQMIDSFLRNHQFLSKSQIKEAINSTIEISERSDVKIKLDAKKALLPSVDVPSKYNGNEFKYIKDLCLQGWTWRRIPDRARNYAKKKNISVKQALQIYHDRLKMELKTLRDLNFVLYFLIVHDMCKFAMDAKIMKGPGRGSGSGSIVSYLLGITSLDPIELGLFFERFINPDRKNYPDFDIDFADSRRHEIVDYIIKKYGRENVCQIATSGKLSGKSVFRDISRVLRVPLSEVNDLSYSIIDRPQGHPRQYNTIEDSFNEFDVFNSFDKKYPEVKKYASKLEGMTKTLGIHAAGVVASPIKLSNMIPLEIRNSNGEQIIVSAINMSEIESVGLVKLDVLGLRTLSVIRDCLDKIKENHGVDIDMEKIDMNDPKVLQLFTNQDFSGVFQYDTSSAYNICKGIVFEQFEDIVALTALNRPGATRSGLAEKYIARKKDPSKRTEVDLHPIINEICSDTFGVIVYQEHCIKIFTDLAGFSRGKADILRGAIGKKKMEVLKSAREEFVNGCKDLHNIDEKLSNKIFSSIEAFGAYGFNLAHAAAYGAIGYWCQYLKKYYPTEFYWSLLKNEPSVDRIKVLAKDAKKHGVSVLNPHVNYSKDIFSIDPKNNIRGSLVDIKGVGVGAAKTIMENQPFKNFVDFLNRIDNRKCNSGAVKAILKSGAMKGLVPNQKYFEENLSELNRILKLKKKSSKIKEFWAQSKYAPDYSNEDKMLLAYQVNPLAFDDDPLMAYRSFIDEFVGVKLHDVKNDQFFTAMDGKSVFTMGVILDCKTHQIGDFHTGELPNDLERKKQFWGSRYSNVNIDGCHEYNYRAKFDIDIFDDHVDIINSGSGTPIIIHATVDGKYNRLRVHFAVDVEKYRLDVRNNRNLDLWSRLIRGEHPLKNYLCKNSLSKKKYSNENFFKYNNRTGMFTGIVTHVRLKYDSKGNQMAFFGIIGIDSYIDVICFASYWKDIRNFMNRGLFISMQIDKVYQDNCTNYFFNGGKVVKRKISNCCIS